jgi:hypothetical protein
MICGALMLILDKGRQTKDDRRQTTDYREEGTSGFCFGGFVIRQNDELTTDNPDPPRREDL